jgi:hypothetical protein
MGFPDTIIFPKPMRVALSGIQMEASVQKKNKNFLSPGMLGILEPIAAQND